MEKSGFFSALKNSKAEYKRKFSFGEFYRAGLYFSRATLKLVKNNKSKLVDKQFIERLQLAVTEVNGCVACSWAHTNMALKQGMSNEEISSLLSGGDNFIKPEESKGIMFAQHFADSKGYPKKYAYDPIVKEYGEEKAKIILSASQVMMVGNMIAIPISALLSRLKGKPYKDSSLFYELKMVIGGHLYLPILYIQGLLRGLIGLPNEKFDNTTDDEDNTD